MPMYKETDYLRLRARVDIDRIELDRELVETPMLLLEAIEFCSTAEHLRDLKKGDLATKISIAAAELREVPYNGKPRSESQITSEVPSVIEVVEAREILADAELTLNLWRGLVDALRQKSHNLKTTSDLTIAGYLSPNAGIQSRREELNEVREIKRRGRAS